jgi:hypothetical protein
MRITPTFGRRAAALVAAGALATTLGAAVVAPAQAATSLGTLTITPATGNESSLLSATLSTSCPGDSTGIVGYLSGPGVTEANGIIQSNRTPATSFAVTGIFKEIFAANSIAAPNGTYTVRMACIGPDFFTENGEFSQQVVFTARGGTNNANYVAQTAVSNTSTTLAAPTPAAPVASGTAVELVATVDGGAAGTPTGDVQFKSGAVNVGAPVPLAAGSATLATTAIPAGTNSLTATYVPSGANPLAGSTSSAVSYVVAGPTSVTGSIRVGGTVTCSAATGGTPTYAWTRNGVATGNATASLEVPASWLNASIACSMTSTVGPNSVTRASAVVSPGLGVAPVATTRPTVRGILKVGKRVTCAPGVWAPSATSYLYQWFRGSKALTGKTGAKYKLARADKGKKISCSVAAQRPAHLDGVAKSPARKVR